ncbi:MAG: FAD-binding oxidoreductase [Verrucomicrobiales bacterium]|nr:FAD-binding oxidoreductase [Verrucomicrobiales bacterium]
MSTAKHLPILIIGQGLAGTLLAWQLIRLGQQVYVVDREEAYTSSKVAGGIVTPITGMRMVKTWRLDDFYPCALEFYRWIETQCRSQFYFEKPIQRLFKNQSEQQLFQQRMQDPGFSQYVLSQELIETQNLDAAFGGFVMQGAFLKTTPLLNSSKDFLDQCSSYQAATVVPSDLQILTDHVQWQGRPFSQVVFCQGWTKKTNPYFDWIPFKPAKGEVLEIHCDALSQKHILNRSGFIAPLGDGKFRAGSTYEWKQLDHQPTTIGRKEICAKIESITDLPYQVTDHQAAVRPVIDGSKCLLGRHPAHPRIAYFNGLASKGVLNAPYLSAMLAQHLINDQAIEGSVDVQKNF